MTCVIPNRIGLVAGLFALALVCCPPVQSQAVQDVKAEGNKLARMPFDVPVQIQVALPEALKDRVEGVRRVEVWRLETRTAVNVAFDSTSPVDDGRHDQKKWKKIETIAGKNRALVNEAGVNVYVDSLKANRYYRFAFRFQSTLAKKEQEEFSKKAIAALDKLFRDTTLILSNEPLDSTKLRAIQRKLWDALPKQDDRNLAYNNKKGSAWDTTTTKKELEESNIAARLGNLLNKTRDRVDLINTFKGPASFGDEDRQDADSFLVALEKDSTLQALYEGFLRTYKHKERPSAVQAVEPIQGFYEASAAGFWLSTLNAEQRRWLIQGRTALHFDSLSSSLEEIDKVWLPARLEARIKNLKVTTTTLDHLIDLLNQLQHLDAYRTSLSISKAELADLSAELETVRMAFQKMPESFDFEQLKRNLVTRQDTIKSIVRDLLIREENQLFFTATSTANFETRAKWYISADAGVLYAPALKDLRPYFGANIYFLGPVNKEALLSSFTGWDRVARSLSVVVGVTVGSVEEEGKRKDLFGSSALVMGLGYRINDTIRLTGGLLLFKEEDPHPLFERDRVTGSPFVSISIDWDVKDTLGGVSGALFDN